MKALAVWSVLIVTLFSVDTLSAQHSGQRAWASNVIVPNTWRQSVGDRQAVQVEKVVADVLVTNLVATTQLDIFLSNPSAQDEMSEVLIPVPNGAVVRKFEFSGNADGAKAELLMHAEANSTFRSIVSKLKDPALLEMAGLNLVRSSVFPVSAGGTQQVRITYEHLLQTSGNRIDYLLPRSGSVSYDTPWTIDLRIDSDKKITSLYSPTHPVTSSPSGKNEMTASVSASGQRNPGHFQISWLLEDGPITGSLFAFPDGDKRESGYFLLLAGMADVDQDNANAKKNTTIRDLTLVLDHSGSMGGEKIEQARNAALQVLEGLDIGERFNVIVYNDRIDKFAEHSVVKNADSMKSVRRFVGGITATGGTNLYDALAESLKTEVAAGSLPLVMFLTDGLPTIGNTSELAIRELVTKQNTLEKRIFTFGVGFDVNTALLDKLSVSSRGFATFVLPEQDVEVAVGKVFEALHGPQLAKPQLRILGANGQQDPGRVTDVLPRLLPDLYRGDQLVLLGRYHGEEPLTLQIAGTQNGQEKKFRLTFDLSESLAGNNSFVARLWASRKIGQLVDEVRDLGATPKAVVAASRLENSSATILTNGPSAGHDPRLAELSAEILRLSMQFGILNEYTAFLATDGTDLSKSKVDLETSAYVAMANARDCRTGMGSVNQELNKQFCRDATSLNIGNRFICPDMKTASVATVQQCNQNAFFRRGNRWIDNRILETGKEETFDQKIEFGSEAYFGLLEGLMKQGRQNELALDGEIVIRVGEKSILITNPSADSPEKPDQDN